MKIEFDKLKFEGELPVCHCSGIYLPVVQIGSQISYLSWRCSKCKTRLD